MFYSPEDRTTMGKSVDIIDEISIEVFVGIGVFSYAIKRDINTKNNDGFYFLVTELI